MDPPSWFCRFLEGTAAQLGNICQNPLESHDFSPLLDQFQLGEVAVSKVVFLDILISWLNRVNSRPYETSRLWNQAFSGRDEQTDRDLQAEYAKAWEKACVIAKGIAVDAPGLTLHDERHFFALWKAADLLVPEDVILTPAEAFIFGVAILIHDAAHTVIAYQGGLEALSQTSEWKDNLVSRLGDFNPDASLPAVADLSESVRKAVAFDTVRALHAAAAPKLLSMSFTNSIVGGDFYLLQDPSIRRHMSAMIGDIAASHHWNIAKVAKLPRARNLVAPYNAYGSIRVMFLAALMRTADAIQIDGSRAPDFELIISNPQGVSALHWAAQNPLATNVDVDDGEALAVNSTSAFQEEQARAWWIAYDLAKVADRELRETDALLRDNGQQRLRLRRVRDIATPEHFAEHVSTDGWVPLSAEVKVGDTARLIELLGGRGLYGNNVTVPLRELIQNAVDAVRARRLLEPGFNGKIVVELDEGKDSRGTPGYWLRVNDDGLGMSPAILTGPFLTFGESGWSSSTLRYERPGFIARRFRHIGRFGIGFFSVFMISEAVRVTSRAFSEGLSAGKTLQFSAGLGLRPLIKDAQGASMSVVTSVELFLDAETKNRLLLKSEEGTVIDPNGTRRKAPAEAYTMPELIGMMCPIIDVDIEGFDSDSGTRAIVHADWTTSSVENWLTRVVGLTSDEVPDLILAHPEMVEVIGAPARPIGRASLNPSKQHLGVFAIGGFGTKKTDRSSRTGTSLVGCIDSAPAGPKRDQGEPLDRDAVARWASAQAEKWSKIDLSDEQRNFIAAHAASFQGDASPVANARIDERWLSVSEVYELLLDKGPIYAPIRSQSRGEQWTIGGTVNLPSGHLFHPDDVKVERENVLVAGATADIHDYWAVPETGSRAPLSFLSILQRYCETRGRELVLEGSMIDFGYYCGENSKREFRTHGERLVIPGIKLELLDIES
ncbi:hypothetical protein HFO27_18140 [Rhizobium leguminosarum]|uniref:HD domain-containing protein n=1 Tax=Rhizobium leguminosarum TaxID=384 RepID=UPI001C919D83|nr:ATP-binding protein [Rhizobium leguminosarum]MBY3176543.1 hypothetical protein [Rhizobium leguminosarum]